MFQNITREGSQANKVLGLSVNSAAELSIIAERELKKVEESPAFKLQKQMEQLKASLAPIGEEFVKAVGPLIEFGTKLLKSFNNLGEGGKQFAVILVAVAGVIAPAALMAFGLIANGVANLLKFFVFLSGAFGRLSGQSTLLGGQTEYMTQQQLEAAAVAASLSQSHSNLTQIFTAEAGAISNLVAQYKAAVIAQRQLSIGQTARGVAARGGARPPGFAKGGIIRGPGTGTSDSIPAMVSDGEFIVSAKRTRQYLPFLQAIAAGKIPGFKSPSGGTLIGTPSDIISTSAGSASRSGIAEKLAKLEASLGKTRVVEGLSEIGKAAIKTSKELTETAAYQRLNRERNIKDIPAHFAHFGEGSAQTAGSLAPQVQGDSALANRVRDISKFAPETPMNVKHGWGFKAAGLLNIEMAEKGAPAQEVLDDFKSRDVQEKWEKGVAQGGGDVSDPEIQKDLTNFDNRIAEILAQRISEVEDAVIVDTQEAADNLPDGKKGRAIVMEDVESQAAADTLQGTKLGSIREKSKNTPTQLRMILTEDLERQRQEALLSEDPEVVAAAQRQESFVTRKSKKQDPDIPSGMLDSMPKEIETKMTEIGRNVIDSTANAMNAAAEASSPAKRFIRIGENIVNSTAMGMEGEAAEQAGKPPLPGNLAAPKPPITPEPSKPSIGRRLADRVGDSPIGKAAGRKLAKMSGNAIADSKGQVYYDPNEDMSTWAGQMTAEQREFEASLPGGVASGVTPVRVVNEVEFDPALQNAMETGSIESENLADTLAQQQSSVQDNTDTVAEKAKQDEAARKENKRQNRQARAGKALAGLGTLTMAAGMATQVEGVVGETAQKLVGPLAALSGIAPILMALPGPLAALAAVVGLGVGAFLLYNKTVNDARKEAYELTKALGTGSEALQKYADFTGKARPSEIRDKQRLESQTPFNIKPGKTPFGQSFLEAEEGQALLSSVQE